MVARVGNIELLDYSPRKRSIEKICVPEEEECVVAECL